MSNAIEFKHVVKEYKLFKNDKQRFKAIFNKRIKAKKKLAINDVSFTIEKGESVALFGRNGAGKSTLLKMITEVIFPTEGEIKVNGRVSALLELTAGFDPEFTGRENIYLNGCILGHSTKYMEEHFDEIVNFAELWDFLDSPVKNYSSGMRARLGFSIATMIQPDILIVDEILSVGDIRFRQKCEARMEEMLNRGTTLLYVSHSLGEIRRLCKNVIWIEKGIVRMIGDTEKVCKEYETFMNRK